MSRGGRVALAVAAAGVLAAPSAASASYYMTQKKAESTTRRHLHFNVGYHHTGASCRPQGRAEPEPGYIYHRWVCYWAAGDSRYEPSCSGTALVRGSSTPGSYYYRVIYHEGKCPLGWDD